MPRKDPCRQRRHAVTDYERQQIRLYYKKQPGKTNKDVAAWASEQFGRRIDATIVHRAMSSKYDRLDGQRFKKNSYVYSRGNHDGDWPELEAALFEWHMRLQASRQHVSGGLIAGMAERL